MNIIIVGAGQVGYTVAEVLAPKNDVMVVEYDDDAASRANSMLNVSLFKGNGTNPKTLEEAITRHRAEVIIATTSTDESNLFICIMAKRFNPDIKTVADANLPQPISVKIKKKKKTEQPEIINVDQKEEEEKPKKSKKRKNRRKN